MTIFASSSSYPGILTEYVRLGHTFVARRTNLEMAFLSSFFFCMIEDLKNTMVKTFCFVKQSFCLLFRTFGPFVICFLARFIDMKHAVVTAGDATFKMFMLIKGAPGGKKGFSFFKPGMLHGWDYTSLRWRTQTE